VRSTKDALSILILEGKIEIFNSLKS